MKKKDSKPKYPIKHWSYSSLMTFLRNPLAWHKRYVEGVYDMPSSPSGIVGRAAHLALQHFYNGVPREAAVAQGLEYLRRVDDFEIQFGKAKGKRAMKEKRRLMEADYVQAVSHYLDSAPKHNVLGVEVAAVAPVPGLELPVKAISDLVVASRIQTGAVDIIDHKFVDSFSTLRAEKPLFVLQAIFNYYTVSKEFGKPVKRFILYECKKRKNKDGSSQMQRYVIDYEKYQDDFRVFHQLLTEATEEIGRKRAYLPNPSDMFEGANSFDIYRLGLGEDR